MAIKILSVDDEPDLELLIMQKFRRDIRKGIYEFVFANNGYQALDRLNEHPDIDFILSDINMPEMDGLTLLDRVKELNRPELKTVMVTAYGDMDNLRTAMNRGAFDFVNKPIDFKDLEITINKTIEQIQQIRESLRQRDQLVSIQQDLNVAKSIQLSLVPSEFPDRTDLEVFGMMKAAKDVGGDLYDFFQIDDEHFGFVIGDVAGKGVPGAIFMALSRTIIRTTGRDGKSAELCMAEANDLICEESIDSMFVTAFYGILNLKTGLFRYSNAGHCPPYLVRKDGSVEMLPTTKNMALGVMDGMPYGLKSVQLSPTDTIFLYTDGVPEAMNPESQIYTDEKVGAQLKELAGKSPKEVSEGMAEDVARHANGADQSDDITILCFEFKG